MSTREVELKYLIAPGSESIAPPPPLPSSWSYAHPEPTRALLVDEYLDDDRNTVARRGLSLRRRTLSHRDNDAVPAERDASATTYWIKGREPAEGALHSRLERQLRGLDDPALAAAIGERGGVAPSLAVRASLRQDRASWVVRHRSGVTGTLSIDRVSGAALGVEVSWSELEVEIHAQEAQAATLAAELDGALKILPFLTPSTIAKIDRATLLATRKSG